MSLPTPAARALLPPLAGLDVVDLGCRVGDFVRWAHDQGAASVLGLDLSTEALDRARLLGEPDGTRFEQADLAQLRLAFASYDVAWCDRVAHEVADPLRLTRVVNAGLRPGGMLVAVVPTPPGPDLLAAVTGARMELERVEEVAGSRPGGTSTVVVARRRPPGPWLRTGAADPPVARPAGPGPPLGGLA